MFFIGDPGAQCNNFSSSLHTAVDEFGRLTHASASHPAPGLKDAIPYPISTPSISLLESEVRARAGIWLCSKCSICAHLSPLVHAVRAAPA